MFRRKQKGGSIILLHFNPYDTERLDEIITAIRKKGPRCICLGAPGVLRLLDKDAHLPGTGTATMQSNVNSEEVARQVIALMPMY